MNDTVNRDNRRSLPRFLLVMLAAALAGGIVGFLIALMGSRGTLEGLWAELERLMVPIIPWGIPLCTIVLLLPGFLLLRSAKQRYAAWDQESEAEYQAIEQRLNYALLLGTVVMLADLFFLAASFLYDVSIQSALFFLLSLILLLLLQQKVVDQIRRMNPEKQGSVYDIHFQKKWLDSCDELERAQIGQASFHAFKRMNAVFPIVWMALILLSGVADIGLLPILLVILLWGVLRISYTLECIRLGRRRVSKP